MKRPRVLKLEGQRFGRLVAIKRVENECPTVTRWMCKCDCGNEVVTRSVRLRNGSCKSCGCLASELFGLINKTHGISKTLTCSSWNMMMNRCFNPNFPSFSRYGAVGILACEFIKSSPVNLVALIGERPSKKLSLDRIDNKNGYTCGTCEECFKRGFVLNVRWATASQQNRNQNRNRII